MTLAQEWPDYGSEIKKKAKAKKKGDNFIVSDSEDEDVKSSHHRASKRKQKGTDFFIFGVAHLSSSASLLFQIDGIELSWTKAKISEIDALVFQGLASILAPSTAGA